MSRLPALLVFLLFTHYGSAQLKVVLREDFTTNSNKWVTGDIANLSVKLADGKYVIDSKMQNTITPQIMAGADSSKDFTIGVSIKTIAINGQAEYGFIFGSNKYAYYCFAASPKGEYVLYSVTNNTISEIIPISKTTLLKQGLNQINKLEIKNKGKRWYLVINGSVADSTVSRRFFGPFAGVSAENIKAEYDDFIITGTPVATSGNLCTLFPLIFQSAKNNFEYIKGDPTDKVDSGIFATSVHLTEDKIPELNLYPDINIFYSILKDKHASLAEAVKYNDNLVIQLRKCLPGFIFTKSAGDKGIPQYLISEKVKSTGNAPQAVLGIAHSEYYMTTLNISSIPVKSPGTIAALLPEKKPTSGWIVNEDFKNNDNKWRVDSNSKIKCSIDFGYYLNSNTAEQNIVLHTFNMPGNETHDYKIETTLQNFDQKDNSPFGLVFGNHDQHAYYFLITNNGSFAIKGTNDTGVIVLKNFTLSNAVHATRNELSSYNKLTIIKLKQTWSFRINDIEVFTCNAGRLGENFGYWIPGNALIRVRTFKIFDWTLADNFPDQPKEVIYNSKFYDKLWTNINNWDELNNTTTKSTFPGLGYRIEHKGDGYFMPALAMAGIGLTDFKFEVQASHQNGATDKQFGLCFGKKDIDNTYVFTIASDGSYEIGKFMNGDWTSIYKGDATAIYKNNYSTNTLSIEQSNGKWFFYVNDQLVHTFYSATLPGSKAGCYVEGDQTVQFENMSFSFIEYRDN